MSQQVDERCTERGRSAVARNDSPEQVKFLAQTMYCGDETGSFIGDVGSHVSRFGYGGDDSPKYVVPSYVGSSNSESQQGRMRVQMSCYNQALASGACKSPLRMVQMPPSIPSITSSTTHESTLGAAEHPIVDPAQYLQQGQEISDWDAYEQLWQSAFDAMRVRDRFKHTVGGGSLNEARTTTGGYTENGDKKVGDEGKMETTTTTATGVSSTTLRAAIPEHKCVHPLLAVSPGCSHSVGVSAVAQASARRKQLIQATELLMEKFDCPAMFIAPTPMLAAFSHGRQTALVVDIGAGGTRVTPVVDGFVLKQSQRRSGRGGDWIGNVQWKALLENKALLRPRYQQMGGGRMISTTGSSGSAMATQGRGIFHRWAMQDLMYELRSSKHVALPDWQSSRTLLFSSQAEDDDDAMKKDNDDDDDDDEEEEEQQDNNNPETADEAAVFELPDGTLIDLTTKVGKDLCRVPELMFADKLPFMSEDTIASSSSSSSSILNEHSSLSNLPLHELIHSALSAVGDVDARKDLAASILLTGGSSLFSGLEERLSYEVSQNVTFKTKVLASRYNVERSCASWIGGSILTSLGFFQQLWLGRTEYDEYGVTMGIQRFP